MWRMDSGAPAHDFDPRACTFGQTFSFATGFEPLLVRVRRHLRIGRRQQAGAMYGNGLKPAGSQQSIQSGGGVAMKIRETEQVVVAEQLQGLPGVTPDQLPALLPIEFRVRNADNKQTSVIKQFMGTA